MKTLNINKKENKMIAFFKKNSKVLIVLAVLAGAGLIVRSIVVSQAKSSGDVKAAIASKQVSKEYEFNGRNAQGYLVDQKIKLRFDTVQKQEEVLIKGNRATARNEKVFLIFDVSLQNEGANVVYLNPLDLVRLVEGDGSKLAPQVHQGNIEIRPQSTKKSNLGFIVDQNRKDFTIQIGELDGEKTTFKVQL